MSDPSVVPSKRMKVLLVSPPRLLWPYMNEQDNFLLPQSLASLAGVLRADGVDITVLDCMPEQVGWASLEKRIRALKPDVVGAGENHAIYAHEVTRLVDLAKRIDPKIVTVLGGAHFTNLPQMYLPKHPIDFIVRGEGEITFRELVRALARDDWQAAQAEQGLAFLRDGEVVQTDPRPLVEDLDSLPIPAYDLMPMDKYGQAKLLFSPGGATIHHSRGCSSSCSFCVWWTQMGKRKRTETGEEVSPRWRTKSVGRVMAEIEILYKQWGHRCLVFVDPTFNADPRWNNEFAEAMIEKAWPINWFAFMRADFILRDEASGVFEKLVRSGLRHVCVGVERAEDGDLNNWDKTFYSHRQSVQVFDLLKSKYPQVFRQATFIVGVRHETPQTLKTQLEFARRIDADYPAFHPATPFPGTAFWEEAKRKNWLEIEDFEYFDLSTPVMRSETMTREEIDLAMIELAKEYVTLPWLIKGLTSRHSYRRNMYIWWTMVTARVFADSVRQRLDPFKRDRYMSLVTPKWYNS